MHEDARDVARRKMTTKAFLKSRDRGSGSRCALRTSRPTMASSGCGSEAYRERVTSFHLAAIVQNLKTLALRLIRPPASPPCA